MRDRADGAVDDGARGVTVLAVVVVGDGPYDLAPLGGVPSVRRAVCSLLTAGVADNVTLFAPAGVGDRALELCTGLPVRLGTPPAVANGGGDGGETLIVLHEAARPLAPPALAASVLAAVRAGARAAVPVLPLTDTVKQLARGELHAGADRASLRVVQSPVAFRAAGGLPCGALDLVARCAAAGEPVHTVAGDAAAFALRTPWDRELAGMVLDGEPG